MQHFVSQRTLATLPRESKVIYSAFCLFALAALMVSLLLYEDLVGPTRTEGWDRIRQYYTYLQTSKDIPALQPNQTLSKEGPKLDLPEEVNTVPPAPLTLLIPTRKLLEVTHFHLFTLPIFLLVLTHLFVLTPMKSNRRVLWMGGVWLCGALHITAPWILRFAGAKTLFLYVGSGMGLFVGTFWIAVYSLWVMWKPFANKRTTTSQ